MGSCVMASAWPDFSWIGNVVLVVLGLGMVIFVHELGHFVAAKLCGVKCEKFYLGFDIGGLKLCKFQWGETEYGIGILPLGGYVKMLGQEDNPARVRQEIERARASGSGASGLGVGGRSPGELANTSQQIPTAPPPMEAKQAPLLPWAEPSQPLPTLPAPTQSAEGRGEDRSVLDQRSPTIPPTARPMEGPSAGLPRRAAQQPPTASTSPGSSPSETQPSAPSVQPDAPPPAEIDHGTNQATFDPRSYLAQSVPKRMVIMSAGVVMNVVFAWVTGVWAYWIGLEEMACGVGAVTPGAPAWEANLRPGDRITHIAGKPVDRYKDLRAAVSVGDIDQGVAIVLERPGIPEPIRATVYPRKTGPYPTIGITPPWAPVLHERLPVLPGSAAAHAQPEFLPGDRIVAIDGQPIEHYAQIHRILARSPHRTLAVMVQREHASGGRSAQAGPQRLTIPLAPMPVRHLGMVMAMGKVTAVQRDSPAEQAGILPGDVITQIDGHTVGDPIRLPDRLRIRSMEPGAHCEVVLTVVRPESPEPLRIPVRLRQADWYENPLLPGSPVSVPALGLSYEVLNRVEAVDGGGPAARAGIRPGDLIAKAELVPPDRQTIQNGPYGEACLKLGLGSPVTADLSKTPTKWPFVFEGLQSLLPGSSVRLTLGDGRVVQIQPDSATDWFHPERGLNFQPLVLASGGQSLAVAVRLGTQETLDSLTLVYRVLKKLGTQQVSPTALAGPIGIFSTAFNIAAQGFADLLVFLTLIGANLAVLNSLPIPVLDGGHMVFLAYEGITGKPPGERIHLALLYLGLLILVALMVWVIGLDIFRLIPRG